MTDNEFLKELIRRGEVSDDGYFEYAHLVAILLPKHLHEQLQQLISNPTYDGDVVCKSYRDQLLSLGLACRVCANNEQGYTAAKYFAYSVMKNIKDIKSGRI